MGKYFYIITIILIYTSINYAQTSWGRVGQPISGYVYSIHEISDTLFVGTSKSGIWYLSQKDTLWKRLDNNSINFSVYCLTSDSKKNLYAGCNSSIYQFSYENDTAQGKTNEKIWVNKSIKTKYNCFALSVLKNGSFLFGTDNGIFINDSLTILYDSLQSNNGLGNLTINNLYTDPENVLYAATISGIFMSSDNGRNWTDISSGLIYENDNYIISGNYVKLICKDSSNNLYAATNGGGIFCYDIQKGKWKNISYRTPGGIQSPYISGIVCNSSGAIFASTYDLGLYYSVNKGRSWKSIPCDNSNQQIYSLYMSENGTLYAGTLGSGVFKIDTSNIK